MTQPDLDDERPVTAEELATMGSEALALMLTVMQHSRHEADHITNGLMAGYQADYYRTLAQLQVVRRQVEHTFRRGYMPTPEVVLDAVNYPDPTAVAEQIARFEKGQF